MCFRKDKRSKLKLIGSQIASVAREKDGYLFHAKLVTKIGADGESLTYHQIGSDEQRELFPEIMSAGNPPISTAVKSTGQAPGISPNTLCFLIK